MDNVFDSSISLVKLIQVYYNCIVNERGIIMLDPVLRISPKKYNGETTIVSMRMSKELLKDIDQVAELTGYKRNDILTMSLEFAINHIEITKKKQEE